MTTRARLHRFVLTVAIAVLVTSCGNESPTSSGGGNGDASNENPPNPPPAGSASVTVGDNFFNPNSVDVNVGQNVRWTWSGSSPHNVTFDDQSVSPSTTQNRGVFDQAFPQAGTFTYYCTIHGRQTMSGQVVVQ